MRLSCKRADRIFWGSAFCTSLKLWHFGTSPRFNDVICDPCWQNERKCARAIWATGKKKAFTSFLPAWGHINVIKPRRSTKVSHGSHITCLGFQKEDTTRNKWLSYIYNTVSEQFNANIRVCAAHFTADYFLIPGESSLQCEHYEWLWTL